MAYSDQQAMDDYRNLPPEDRPKVKEFAQLLEQNGVGKKVSHLYEQVDRETSHSDARVMKSSATPMRKRATHWPKMTPEEKHRVLTEFKRLQDEETEDAKHLAQCRKMRQAEEAAGRLLDGNTNLTEDSNPAPNEEHDTLQRLRDRYPD